MVFTSILENSRATSSFVVAMPVFGFDFPLPTAGWLGLLSREGPGRAEKGGNVGSRDERGNWLVGLVDSGAEIGSLSGCSTFVRSVMGTLPLSVTLALAGS